MNGAEPAAVWRRWIISGGIRLRANNSNVAGFVGSRAYTRFDTLSTTEPMKNNNSFFLNLSQSDATITLQEIRTTTPLAYMIRTPDPSDPWGGGFKWYESDVFTQSGTTTVNVADLDWREAVADDVLADVEEVDAGVDPVAGGVLSFGSFGATPYLYVVDGFGLVIRGIPGGANVDFESLVITGTATPPPEEPVNAVERWLRWD